MDQFSDLKSGQLVLFEDEFAPASEEDVPGVDGTPAPSSATADVASAFETRNVAPNAGILGTGERMHWQFPRCPHGLHANIPTTPSRHWDCERDGSPWDWPGKPWDYEQDGSPWDWPKRQVELAFTSLHGPQLAEAARQTPRIVRDSGPQAAFRYLEFFTLISNAHTARAYRQAVDQFLAFCDPHARTLIEVAPYLVSKYLEASTLSIPSRKQHLAALRRFFGHLVAQHVLPLNPAVAISGPKYSQARGKTPALTAREARQLLDSIETDSIIGLRDRAMIGVMVYSFARVGAVVKLQVGDYFSVGKAWWLRLLEKGGKLHEVPAHHNAEKYLDEYIEGAGIHGQPKAPLFRSLSGRARSRGADQECTRRRYAEASGMDTNDVLRMIKRRADGAGLSTRIGCHTFRATGITVFLQNGGTLEKAQQIAAHADPKTTKLYDRSNDALSLDEIERVLI